MKLIECNFSKDQCNYIPCIKLDNHLVNIFINYSNTEHYFNFKNIRKTIICNIPVLIKFNLHYLEETIVRNFLDIDYLNVTNEIVFKKHNYCEIYVIPNKTHCINKYYKVICFECIEIVITNQCTKQFNKVF